MEVDLEARVARLEHDVVVRHLELVHALDAELELAAAQLRDRVVQRQEARVLHHRRERQVAAPQRRQDAGQHDATAHAAR
ncbi:MAG: hypothetical protein RL186_1561, partial [Pseudomonadota bacterium]